MKEMFNGVLLALGVCLMIQGSKYDKAALTVLGAFMVGVFATNVT